MKKLEISLVDISKLNVCGNFDYVFKVGVSDNLVISFSKKLESLIDVNLNGKELNIVDRAYHDYDFKNVKGVFSFIKDTLKFSLSDDRDKHPLVTIELPSESSLTFLNFKNVYGDASFKDLKLDCLTLTSVNGDFLLNNCEINKTAINVKNGDIDILASHLQAAIIKLVSGDLIIDNALIELIDVNLISGDFKAVNAKVGLGEVKNADGDLSFNLTNLPQVLNLKAGNGDISLIAPGLASDTLLLASKINNGDFSQEITMPHEVLVNADYESLKKTYLNTPLNDSKHYLLVKANNGDVNLKVGL